MIELTPDARAKIQELVDAGAVRDPALRIELERENSEPGRRYAISLVEREDRQRTEIAINVEGIRVFLNLDTSNLLSGARIDWAEAAGGFEVHDPNARARAAAAPRASITDEAASPFAERVQAVIDERINPGIASHGGYVELVDADEEIVHLRMSGGCQGCAASQATLRMGIERTLRDEFPSIRDVVDVTDHAAGVNPYY